MSSIETKEKALLSAVIKYFNVLKIIKNTYKNVKINKLINTMETSSRGINNLISGQAC